VKWSLQVDHIQLFLLSFIVVRHGVQFKNIIIDSLRTTFDRLISQKVCARNQRRIKMWGLCAIQNGSGTLAFILLFFHFPLFSDAIYDESSNGRWCRKMSRRTKTSGQRKL